MPSTTPPPTLHGSKYLFYEFEIFYYEIFRTRDSFVPSSVFPSFCALPNYLFLVTGETIGRMEIMQIMTYKNLGVKAGRQGSKE